MTINSSRRSFLKTMGLAGAAVPAMSLLPSQLAFSATGSSDQTVVVIFLRGGMDGISTLVPFNEPAYFANRPGIAIPAEGRIDLDGQFALHDAMRPLLNFYNQGELAFVHATGLGPDASTRSHFDAQSLMETAVNSVGEPSGWLGRYLEGQNSVSTFGSVGIGRVQRTLNGFNSALGITNLSDFRLNAPNTNADVVENALARLYGEVDHPVLEGQANQALAALRIAQAESLGGQAKPSSYGASRLGDSLHQVAQLMQADVGLQATCIDMGGWDLHSEFGTWDAGSMRNQLQDLSVPLAAFYDEIGFLRDSVTVVVMSEFGRRVIQNDSGGVDHGKGGLMMVLGGGINGGQVYGDWPGLDQLDNGDLAITTDYRLVLSELIDRRLGSGSELDAIFPDYLIDRPYLGLVS